MTEAELAARLIERCDELGVNHFHAHDARRSEPGWVDYVLWGPGGVLFVELKSEEGRCSRAQLRVANSLRRAGAQYRLWRPRDAAFIEVELRLLAGGTAAFERLVGVTEGGNEDAH